jgi:hypothetical protein
LYSKQSGKEDRCIPGSCLSLTIHDENDDGIAHTTEEKEIRCIPLGPHSD